MGVEEPGTGEHLEAAHRELHGRVADHVSDEDGGPGVVDGHLLHLLLVVEGADRGVLEALKTVAGGVGGADVVAVGADDRGGERLRRVADVKAVRPRHLHRVGVDLAAQERDADGAEIGRTVRL